MRGRVGGRVGGLVRSGPVNVFLIIHLPAFYAVLRCAGSFGEAGPYISSGTAVNPDTIAVSELHACAIAAVHGFCHPDACLLTGGLAEESQWMLS